MAKLKTKQKKQFRLYDVYRYATTGEMSNITGIVSYECNRDASTLVIRYTDYDYSNGISKMYFSKNEDELKQNIKEINKRLGNCMRPGRRRK